MTFQEHFKRWQEASSVSRARFKRALETLEMAGVILKLLKRPACVLHPSMGAPATLSNGFKSIRCFKHFKRQKHISRAFQEHFKRQQEASRVSRACFKSD